MASTTKASNDLAKLESTANLPHFLQNSIFGPNSVSDSLINIESFGMDETMSVQQHDAIAVSLLK